MAVHHRPRHQDRGQAFLARFPDRREPLPELPRIRKEDIPSGLIGELRQKFANVIDHVHFGLHDDGRIRVLIHTPEAKAQHKHHRVNPCTVKGILGEARRLAPNAAVISVFEGRGTDNELGRCEKSAPEKLNAASSTAPADPGATFENDSSDARSPGRPHPPSRFGNGRDH